MNIIFAVVLSSHSSGGVAAADYISNGWVLDWRSVKYMCEDMGVRTCV